MWHKEGKGRPTSKQIKGFYGKHKGKALFNGKGSGKKELVFFSNDEAREIVIFQQAREEATVERTKDGWESQACVHRRKKPTEKRKWNPLPERCLLDFPTLPGPFFTLED